ncbi:NHLP family bacteriocin export ABC transporter peptidase/permease/ATPase subunit, partial [Coleofasciculus sp.]|uniref:NHLP family bacteriocin export ABC transporter peptidase/permease/ATPase subunit n=1 Tax=Coleofasciculus sp. TaxID=3100458 RepID=UPI003A1BF72D
MTTVSVTSLNPFHSLKKRLKRRPRRVKTPTLLQMEAMECGAAALGIILSYYGRIVPLPELRQTCGVSRDGSKAANILKAARLYGLDAQGYKQEIQDLPDLRPPYIIFWNFNHFLVVEGIGKRQVYVNDPGTGPRTVSFSEFDASYTGIVLVMTPNSDFVKGGRKFSTILALWERLQGTVGALMYCIMAGFLLTLVGMAIPVFSQIFVDEILIQGRQQWLRPLLIGLGITAILQGLLTQLRLRYLRRLKVKLSVGMSSRFLWHILRLPVDFYAQRFAGEITYRSRLNDQVAEVLSGRLTTTVIDAVMVIFYGLVMVQYDPILTGIVVGFAAVNVFILQSVSRKRKDANQRLIQEHGKAAGASIAALQSIETVKASGLESDVFSRWAGYYTKAINSQQELDVTNQVFSVLPTVLSAISSLFLLVVGGWRVMDGYLSIGMLVAFQGLMQSFLLPVNNLVSFASMLQELEGNLIRLDDVLCNPIDPQVAPKPANFKSQYPKLQGYVELQAITFGYSRVDPPLIENFSLKVLPGQRIALVGSSGSGKSTLAKLISGLYQPWSGDIYFDGQLRTEIPDQVLTHSVAMVEQTIQLFGGTVRDNLTLWNPTIPETNLVRACQDAVIDDVILSLPGGYDAQLIANAANLSGGQRQRLEIARALVNNPSILIMDEATSALDAETERMIDENLRRRGCTCLIVAHRLSTIRDCDQIIVLERGKVVQRGTHQDLWQVEGVYSTLIQNQ